MTDKKPDFIIIPENILCCQKIPANAKLLYGKILLLCNDKGYCWSSNQYFANIFGVSVTSISLWITSLKENGFIKCNTWENYENYTRQIFLTKSLSKIKEPYTFLVSELLKNMPERSLRKLKKIYKATASLNNAVAKKNNINIENKTNPQINKDDFNIVTKEWTGKDGQRHGEDTIDYE